MRQGLGGRIVRGALFTRLKDRAVEYLRDPDKLRDLVQQGSLKANQAGRSGALGAFWDSLLRLFRLLRAYVKREYTNVPLQSLILIVAAVLYFVLPIDVIPDFLVGFGYLDDAAVIAWVVATVKKVLDDFAVWEAAQATQLSTSALDPPSRRAAPE
jgi:uncharacterized membrane protein YkvA (DUF1232 family)